MTTTHRATAAAVAIVEVSFIPAPLPVKAGLLLLGIHAGAWPDLDTPGSTPSREFGPVSQFVSWVVRSVAHMVQWATRDEKRKQTNGIHRRWTHCVEACALAGLLVWVVVDRIGPLAAWSMWFGLVAFVGAFSHVVLGDFFTKSGVPISLTYNLLVHHTPWRDHRAPIYARTDHPSEHLVVMLLVRIAVVEAVVVALRLPVTPYVLTVGAVVGAVWHALVFTGVLQKAMR